MAIMTLVAIWQVRGSAAANALALAIAAGRAGAGPSGAGGAARFFGLGRSALVAALLISPIALLAAGKAVAWTAGQSPARNGGSFLQRPGHLSFAVGLCTARAPAKGLVLAFIDAAPDGDAAQRARRAVPPQSQGQRGDVRCVPGPPDEAGARLAARSSVDYVAFCRVRPSATITPRPHRKDLPRRRGQCRCSRTHSRLRTRSDGVRRR